MLFEIICYFPAREDKIWMGKKEWVQSLKQELSTQRNSLQMSVWVHFVNEKQTSVKICFNVIKYILDKNSAKDPWTGTLWTGRVTKVLKGWKTFQKVTWKQNYSTCSIFIYLASHMTFCSLLFTPAVSRVFVQTDDFSETNYHLLCSDE